MVYPRSQIVEEWTRLCWNERDFVARSIMVDGVDLCFVEDPPVLRTSCPAHLVTTGFQEEILLKFIPEWIKRGIVMEFFHPIPLHFSRVFSVPKGESDWRPIIDLSPMNKLLKRARFRMEDLGKVAKSLSPGLWAVKLDLKEAYWHLFLALHVIKYFGFALGRRIFAFLVLPFGLSPAPWLFTRVMKPVKKALRRLGVRISSFLDDFLILARSRQEALDHTKLVIDFLQRLGFRINWKKSVSIPQKRIEYLGVLMDLEAMTFSLPQDKVEKLLSLLEVAASPSVQRLVLESLVGFLSFAASYLPLGRLWIKPLQHWVNTHSSPLARKEWVVIDDAFREALLPWADRAFLEASVPIKVGPPSLVLMTDAVVPPFQARGSWTSELKTMSINWLELKAVHLGLRHFLPLLKGHSVSLRADNMTALSCVRKQGSLASPALWSLSREILLLAWRSDVHLIPQHLKGVLNVLADKASRDAPVSTEWSLDDDSFQVLCDLLGTPQVDLMATSENSKLFEYVSPCPDEMACGIDALSLDWNRWDSIYLFPPFQLLPEVVLRLTSFEGSGFLVAPLWPSALWFPSLAARCPRRHPLRVGHSLVQWTSRGLVALREVDVYKLHAWIL